MTSPSNYFDKIELAKDGNCLFRAFAVFLNRKLLESRRLQLGYPTNKEYKNYENNCVEFIRSTVVRYIENFKINYENSLYFDDTLYHSIDDRICKMTNDGEFGGKLEIDILSKMYKIVICIFIYLEDKDEYSCVYHTDHLEDINIDEVQKCNYNSGKFCFLELSNQHYSLLKPNDNFVDSKLHINTKTPLEKLINYLPNKTENESNNNYDCDGYLSSSHSSCNSNFEQIAIPEIDNKNKQMYENLDNIIKSGKNGLIINTSDKPKILELQPSMGGVSIDDLVKFVEISND